MFNSKKLTNMFKLILWSKQLYTLKKIKQVFFVYLFVLFFIHFAFAKKIYSTENEELRLEGTIKNVTGCFGNKNGYIKVYGVGGTPDYIYSINNWQTSQNTGDFLNLDVGLYTVKVRDALGAEAFWEIEITQPEEFKLIGQKTNVTGCFGYQNATITLSASGGIMPYLFSIDNGLTFSENTYYTDLKSGYYTIKGKDKNNCEKSFSVNIYEPDKINISEIKTTHVTPCFGDKNGKAEIFANGGTGNIFYSINSIDFQEFNTFENLDAGTFKTTVKDENNCTIEKDFIINQPVKLNLDSITTQDLSCYNSNDGKIKIYASGGTIPLNFSILDDNFSTNSLFENLSAADYFVKIKDNSGCFVTKQISLYQEDELIISEIHQNLNCNNSSDGSITLYASGGAGNYQYSINSGINFQVNSYFSNLGAKTYSIIVKDKDNCQKTSQITLSEPSGIVFDSIISKNLICNGDLSGQISIYAHGGTGTLFYSINSGETFQNQFIFNELAAGYYPISIKDENSCTQTASATLKEPIFEISFTKSDSKCFESNSGSVNFSVYGSSPPFQFSSDEGIHYQEITVFSNLAKEIYNFVIKDQIGCKKFRTIEIFEPDELIMNETINSGCLQSQDVSITFNSFGGKTPYRFSIDNGLHFQNENIFSNLNVGNYNLKVFDANNCLKSKYITIQAPDILAVSKEKQNLLCFNDFTGKINFSVTGGIKPYLFSINNGANFQSDSLFTGLSAQIYAAIIKDQNNCQHIEYITLTQPQSLNFLNPQITHIENCWGDTTGSFSIQAVGGTGEKIYQLNSDTTKYQIADFQNLKAGNYIINAQDANVCKISTQINIQQPDELKILEIFKNNVTTCYNFNTGSVEIRATGGIVPLSYSINNGVNFQNSSLFENIKSGEYFITVKDVKNCYTNSYVEITQPEELTLSYSKSDISCFGEADGYIEVSASGGTGETFFSIDNGLTFSKNALFQFLPKGNYSILAKDANNCRTSPALTYINEPLKLLFSTIKATDLHCDRINSGEIEAQASGGIGNLLYSLDNSVNQSVGIFKNLAAGTHKLKVEDENNCSLSIDIELLSSDNQCIIIPTAFTPNSDGINDTWEIQYFDLYPEAWVQIYDRNGNTITYYKSGEKGWDGTFNNRAMPMGSYWYRLKLSKDSEELKGYFSLVR